MRLLGNTSIRAQACEVPEGNGVWHFTRVGPFSTRGGNSWTGVTTVHDEHARAVARLHEGRASLFVGDHVLGSADASGDLLGYPPIHQHHWHYFHASDLGRDFLSVHGDQIAPGATARTARSSSTPTEAPLSSCHSWESWPNSTTSGRAARRRSTGTPLAACSFTIRRSRSQGHALGQPGVGQFQCPAGAPWDRPVRHRARSRHVGDRHAPLCRLRGRFLLPRASRHG